MNDVDAAIRRLVLSRSRIRSALEAEMALRAPKRGEARRPYPAWLQRLLQLPGAGLLAHLVGDWWAKHPLHIAGSIAAQGLDAVVYPAAKRHPLVVAAGALVLGVVAVRSRPWRWLLSPALIGLAPHLLGASPRRSSAGWLPLIQMLTQTAQGRRAAENRIATPGQGMPSQSAR